MSGHDEWGNTGYNQATMRFLRLMAATVQTEKARAIYLSFLGGKQRLLPEYGGNKNEGIR